jgi:8-hydroxy-5-deazaflavin:NADPH oxidoreductase
MVNAQSPPGAGVEVDRPRSVGIIGGTGALGRGLALRWSMAGIDVRLGSRDETRASDRASSLGERLQGRPGVGEITGGTNRAVAVSERVLLLAVPMEGLDRALESLHDLVDGHVLICAVNPLTFDAQGPLVSPTPGTSVAGSVAASLPRARVVAAFHTVSSRELTAIARPMDDDVPIVGDDAAACATVAALADRIEGCRAVLAGPLRLAGSLEALTPVLIAVNQRSGAHVGVRFSRLP